MNKGNLLIVDDEPLLLKKLKLNLEEYADEIFTASDGIEALKIISNGNIHCVICDVNMPRLNGVEVIKRIREANNDVPFVFFTGHGNHDLMLEAAKYGAFDFFNKPNFDGLEDVISRGLSEGFHVQTEETMMSEYQKIMNHLGEKN